MSEHQNFPGNEPENAATEAEKTAPEPAAAAQTAAE